MNWIDEEIREMEGETRKGKQDPRMYSRLIYMILFLTAITFLGQFQADAVEFERYEARRIPVSGSLWRCSHCNNLQVNDRNACDFCGCRVDRD